MSHTKDKTYRLAWIVAVPLMLCIFLSGCSGVKQLEIFKKEVPREKLNLNKPTPLELENLRWIIITSNNAEEVFKKLEEQGIDHVLWGLTEKDLEAHIERLDNDLSKNTEFRIKWPRGEMGSLPADSEQFMLIEDLYGSVEKIEKNLEQNMTNKVNIEFLQKQVEKMLEDIEELKDKNREIVYKNGGTH